MPVFYFDTEINGEGRSRDEEGVLLPDARAAKHEGITAIYSLAAELDPEINSRHLRLIVRDQLNAVTFEMDLVMTVKET